MGQRKTILKATSLNRQKSGKSIKFKEDHDEEKEKEKKEIPKEKEIVNNLKEKPQESKGRMNVGVIFFAFFLYFFHRKLVYLKL